jgi:hypothetical protein
MIIAMLAQALAATIRAAATQGIINLGDLTTPFDDLLAREDPFPDPER